MASSVLYVMTDLEAEQVVIWYKSLEAQLETFLKIIPLSYENRNIHLPLLAPLIVEAGSLIDTIFREEFLVPSTGKKKLDIKDFARHFEERYKLSQVKSLLFQHPPRYLVPFEGWTSIKTGNYVERTWWTNYNRIKHDRIKKYSLATLGEAASIVCALQQIVSSLPTFTRALWRHDLLDAVHNVHYVGQNIEESQIRYFGMVETRLFVTPIGHERFPHKIEDITPFWFGGKKLAKFLGRT